MKYMGWNHTTKPEQYCQPDFFARWAMSPCFASHAQEPRTSLQKARMLYNWRRRFAMCSFWYCMNEHIRAAGHALSWSGCLTSSPSPEAISSVHMDFLPRNGGKTNSCQCHLVVDACEEGINSFGGSWFWVRWLFPLLGYSNCNICSEFFPCLPCFPLWD